MPRSAIFALICVIAFVSLALPAASQQLIPGDSFLYGAMQTLRLPLLRPFFHVVTEAGSYKVLVPIGVGILFWQRKHVRRMGFLTLYALGIVPLEVWAKLAIARPRPHDYLGLAPLVHTSHGFPSGHALAAAAFYGMLLVLLRRDIDNPTWQYVLSGGTLVLVLLIGVSRIYIGAHWPSDVLGGFALGGGYCILAKAVYERIERQRGTLQGGKEREPS